MKNRQIQAPAISHNGAGVGKTRFRGPGLFQLRIVGAVGWTVRVYDGV